MRWISENIICLSETVRTVPVFQGGEGTSDNILGRVDDPLERLPLCNCAAGKPHTDALCEDALYGAAVEGHKQFLCKLIVPNNSQKVQSLMCLLDGSSGVGVPSQVIIEVEAQESEIGGPLHTVPIDEQGLNVRFLSPAVNNQFLGLGNVQSQVVFYTPH